MASHYYVTNPVIMSLNLKRSKDTVVPIVVTWENLRSNLRIDWGKSPQLKQKRFDKDQFLFLGWQPGPNPINEKSSVIYSTLNLDQSEKT